MASYIDEYIDKLKLNNQSGTVCSLECYYKEGKDGEAKRADGGTGSFPVGQSKTLNLNELSELTDLTDKGREVWVTAFANVKAGKDSNADVWLRFKKDSSLTGEYTISGVINFTKVAFNQTFE